MREITPKWHTRTVSTSYERKYQNVPKLETFIFTHIIMYYCYLNWYHPIFPNRTLVGYDLMKKWRNVEKNSNRRIILIKEKLNNNIAIQFTLVIYLNLLRTGCYDSPLFFLKLITYFFVCVSFVSRNKRKKKRKKGNTAAQSILMLRILICFVAMIKCNDRY